MSNSLVQKRHMYVTPEERLIIEAIICLTQKASGELRIGIPNNQLNDWLCLSEVTDEAIREVIDKLDKSGVISRVDCASGVGDKEPYRVNVSLLEITLLDITERKPWSIKHQTVYDVIRAVYRGGANIWDTEFKLIKLQDGFYKYYLGERGNVQLSHTTVWNKIIGRFSDDGAVSTKRGRPSEFWGIVVVNRESKLISLCIAGFERVSLSPYRGHRTTQRETGIDSVPLETTDTRAECSEEHENILSGMSTGELIDLARGIEDELSVRALIETLSSVDKSLLFKALSRMN